MFTFIITLTIIVAVLLVLVVLAQNSKGGGLSSQFGGSGSSTQMIGVKRTADFLEKATWALAIALMVLALSSSFLLDTQSSNAGFTSPNIESAQDRIAPPTLGTDIPAAGDSAASDLEGLTEPDSTND
ncbi:preprotein translocase subunit SecG [Tunicatimonas pelagia]|uniref:preprotein translocase subunit SecG n=1 Tax=Tunicatimonas pelagia TaxID=931531 RepID=UPI00266704CF|nr:preprotein translocase subunit SecG [Tunicatimonas pelagia]WKN43818.1 preprotein translocase subunit SecG [Tunicatimonas pelagia]